MRRIIHTRPFLGVALLLSSSGCSVDFHYKLRASDGAASYGLEIVSPSETTVKPVIKLSGFPVGTIVELMVDADSQCSGGYLHGTKTLAVPNDTIEPNGQSILSHPPSFRVRATLPSGEVICTGAREYSYRIVSNVTSLSVGGIQVFAKSQGEWKAWGGNVAGALGLGDTVDRMVATPVPALSDAVKVISGDRHSCAILTDATVKCWGSNAWGQLG